jgi:hypothetical protein
MTKNEEVNDGVLVGTTLASNQEETVDVEVTRIVAEKQSDSSGFTSADDGHDGSFCDGEEGQEEV